MHEDDTLENCQESYGKKTATTKRGLILMEKNGHGEYETYNSIESNSVALRLI